ncbi:MAG: DUF1836 domain-containing protein [Candidatus Metalachnospira sp.]|nr:DUF1836 domain-containing protein [Candidatus Metalachnospira sp.]
MDVELGVKLEEINNEIKTCHIPMWEELPAFELYMDQVISLLNLYLAVIKDDENENESITKNMINNYVKMKIIPAPIKKKYSKVHMAYLVLVCMLKQVFSISMIKNILRADATEEEIAKIYNSFVTNVYEAAAFDLEKYSNVNVDDEENCVIKLSAEAIILKTMAVKVINK